jgi:hypothetical protein
MRASAIDIALSIVVISFVVIAYIIPLCLIMICYRAVVAVARLSRLPVLSSLCQRKGLSVRLPRSTKGRP